MAASRSPPSVCQVLPAPSVGWDDGRIVCFGLQSVPVPGLASVPHPVLTLQARAVGLFCRLCCFSG